jgi:hypothetical protein
MSTEFITKLEQNGVQDTESAVMFFGDNNIERIKIHTRAKLEDGTVEPHIDPSNGIFNLVQSQVELMFAETETVKNSDGDDVVVDGGMIYQWFATKFDKVYVDSYPEPVEVIEDDE